MKGKKKKETKNGNEKERYTEGREKAIEDRWNKWKWIG